ncbi:DNA-directed RNA polymerase subunit omega [candidate division KSB1 bacterium]|nr:DNA-directed RNA polymerase subunit omega [candidate division KSB1 bacterium]
MAGTPIHLNELEKHVDSVYEAVIIIAKRAKQINDEQKRLIEMEYGLDDESDNYDEDELTENDRLADREYLKLPKPTKIALEEMLTGQLKFEYLNKDQ